MPASVCECPRTQCCQLCFEQAIMWFGGMAIGRGIRWAEDVARRRPALLARPWPCDGRAAELARAKVRDLSDDPRVIDRLAASVAEFAARRWRQLQ